jgi:hypothetical protein
MIIAFAFGVIGSLLVLANSKHLRKQSIFISAILLASAIAALGIYFILNASKDMDGTLLFPMFSPLTALVLWYIARYVYKARTGLEIIMHMHGLIPVRQEERYVTREEKNITFILLVLSTVLPYSLLIMVL